MAFSDHLPPQSEAVPEAEDTVPISPGEALSILETTLTKWLAPLSTLLPPTPAKQTEAATKFIAHPLVAKWLDPPPHAVNGESDRSTIAAPDSFLLRIVLPSAAAQRRSFGAPVSAVLAKYLGDRLEAAKGPEQWVREVFKVLNMHYLCAQRYSPENKVSGFAVGRTLAAQILQETWLESDAFLEEQRQRTEGVKMDFDGRKEREEVISDEVVETVLSRLLDQLADQGWRVNIVIDGLDACENYVWLVRALTRMVDRDLLTHGRRGTFRVLFTGSPRAVMCGVLRKWDVVRVTEDGIVEDADNGTLVSMAREVAS